MVAAATTQQDVGVLNFWLGNIREVHRIHRDELQAIKDDEARHRRLVELNVGEQVRNSLSMLCTKVDPVSLVVSRDECAPPSPTHSA